MLELEVFFRESRLIADRIAEVLLSIVIKTFYSRGVWRTSTRIYALRILTVARHVPECNAS